MKPNKRNLEVHIARTAEDSPKEFYSYVGKKKVLISTIGLLSLQNGRLQGDERKWSDLLNEYFATVFSKEDINGFQEDIFELRNLTSLNSCNLSENVIIKTTEKLKKKKKILAQPVLPRVS